MHLKTMDGRDVTCVQIAGLVARRILNYVEAGAGLTAGQRYGFIRFGSRSGPLSATGYQSQSGDWRESASASSTYSGFNFCNHPGFAMAWEGVL